MPPMTGAKMKMYINTGTVAIPVWTEISEVGDVAIDGLSRTVAELKRRAKEFTKGLPGLIGLITASFTLHHGLGAANFTTIQTAFFAGTIKEWAFMNGAITGSGNQGLRCPFLISDFPWNQPLEEASGHEVKLSGAYMEEPAGTEIDPSWYTVA